MWCRWWGTMIPGCVWEYSSLEKWRAPPSLPLTLSDSPLTQSETYFDSWNHRWSWSSVKAELVMNTSSILMAWENPGRCQAPVKRNMDFHFKQAVLWIKNGGGEGGGAGVQTTVGPLPGRGPPSWAAVQRLFTVSDSNRDPLKDKRSCVGRASQLASGWSGVLFNDPQRGQGRGTWGDTQEIPGCRSSPMWESWLRFDLAYSVELRLWLVKDWLLLFQGRKAISVFRQESRWERWLACFCTAFIGRPN